MSGFIETADKEVKMISGPILPEPLPPALHRIVCQYSLPVNPEQIRSGGPKTHVIPGRTPPANYAILGLPGIVDEKQLRKALGVEHEHIVSDMLLYDKVETDYANYIVLRGPDHEFSLVSVDRLTPDQHGQILAEYFEVNLPKCLNLGRNDPGEQYHLSADSKGALARAMGPVMSHLAMTLPDSQLRTRLQQRLAEGKDLLVILSPGLATISVESLVPDAYGQSADTNLGDDYNCYVHTRTRVRLSGRAEKLMRCYLPSQPTRKICCSIERGHEFDRQRGSLSSVGIAYRVEFDPIPVEL